jgi:hypothetical protein
MSDRALAVLAAIVLIAISTSAFWVPYASGGRENAKHVNPAIFQAFRRWEQRCLQERWPNETVRCRGLLSYMRSCEHVEFGCSASDYYDHLWDIGFDLPPYYEPGYEPKGWFWFLSE